MTTTLSDDDVETFRKQGYLLPGVQLYAPEKLDTLETIFDEHLADKGTKLSDELDTPHFRDPRLLDYLLGDEVLDLVEPLVGPDIALWTSHFISKDPFTGRATPWHEDSAFWNGRFDRYDSIVTVWLALGPSNRSNGCMRVVPGSHLLGGFHDNYVPTDMSVQTFHAEIPDVDEGEAVDFELERGQFSLHDGRIVHGARPNTSPVRRTGYTMRYFPASVRMMPVEQNEGWKIWLARGEDRAGNTYANVPSPSTGSGNGSTGSGNGSTGSRNDPTGSGNVPTGSGNVPTGSGNVPTGSGNVPTGSGNVPTGSGSR